MKKGLFLLLLIVLFTGCTERNEEDKIEEKGLNTTIFELPEVEFDVCKDGCDYGIEEFDAHYDFISDKIFEFQVKLSPDYDHDAFATLQNDEITLREDIVTNDVIFSYNTVHLTQTHGTLSMAIHELKHIMSYCSDNEECDYYPIIAGDGFYLTDIEYGFNDTSGYLTYTHLKDSDESATFTFSLYYEFTGEDVNYEFKRIHTGVNEVIYSSMIDGEFKHYESSKNEYSYINLNTMEVFYLEYDDENIILAFYDHNKEILYTYSNHNDDFYLMKVLDEFVPVVIYEQDEEKEVRFNFHYINGWDSIFVPQGNHDDITSYYATLYQDEEEVFSEVNVFTMRYGIRYYAVEGIVDVTDTYDSYEFPIELANDYTMDDLRSDFDTFVDLENPVEISGLNLPEIGVALATLKADLLGD